MSTRMDASTTPRNGHTTRKTKPAPDPLDKLLEADPPNNQQAERALLGGLMIKLATEEFDALKVAPEDFWNEDNRRIFTSMSDLRRDGKPIDALLLAPRLEAKFPAMNWKAILAEITNEHPVAAHTAHYARDVHDTAVRRRHLLWSIDGIKHARNGATTADLVRHAQTIASVAKEEAGTAISFEQYSGADLAEGQFELRYAIDGLVVDGQPTIVGGPHKSLKTSLLLDLAISLASGGYFLGRFRVAEPKNVAIFSGESGMATLAETAKRIAATAGCDLSSLNGFTVVPLVPKVNRAESLDAMAKLARQRSLGCLIVDPAYLAFDGMSDRAGNIFAMGEALSPLAAMCRAEGVLLIVAHHTKKGRLEGRFDPLELEELAYSGWSEFARQWLLVNRRKAYEEGTGRHELWLRSGGSAGHSSLWGLDIDEGANNAAQGRQWNVRVIPSSEVRAVEKELRQSERKRRDLDSGQADVEKVLRALQQFPAGETLRNIRCAAGVGEDKARAILFDLMRQGLVEECGVHKSDRKTPRRGFKRAEGDQ